MDNKKNVFQLVTRILLGVFIVAIVGFPLMVLTLISAEDNLIGWVTDDGNTFFYFEKGKKYVNCNSEIEGEIYKFDENGHMYSDIWLEEENGDRFFYDKSGAMVRNAWQSSYYLLEDGKVARNQYVGRFYLGESGKWVTNSYDKARWRVDGDWNITDDKCFFVTLSGEEQSVGLSEVKAINFLGWNTGSEYDPPQQSIIAYEEALNHGYKVLLCDLRYTADGVSVCFHDANINGKARNMNGSKIEGDNIEVSKYTLESLNQYDYGIYRGEQYKGTKMLTFKEMLAFAAEKSVKELYVSVKAGSKEQIKKTVELAKQYNVKISWICTSVKRAQAVIGADPTARVALTSANIRDILPDLLSLKTGSNEVFIYAPGNAILDSELVKELKDNDIAFEMGNIESEEEVVRYWNGDYAYCSGITSTTVVASDIDVVEVVKRMKGE